MHAHNVTYTCAFICMLIHIHTCTYGNVNAGMLVLISTRVRSCMRMCSDQNVNESSYMPMYVYIYARIPLFFNCAAQNGIFINYYYYCYYYSNGLSIVFRLNNMPCPSGHFCFIFHFCDVFHLVWHFDSLPNDGDSNLQGSV